VDGFDVLERSLDVRTRIGYLPENTPLYSDMRVIEFLEFIARIRKIPFSEKKARFDQVIQVTGIERMLKKNIGHLSKGFRQRVGLAQALIHDPPILILDEPTSGLDPHQIIEIRELIRELGKSKTIVFSSHILQEISAICTRIIIIQDGKIIADGTPQDLQSMAGRGRIYRLKVQGPADAIRSKLAGLAGVETADIVGESDGFKDVQVRTGDGKDLGPQIFQAVKDGGWSLALMDCVAKSLEDVYLQLTKRTQA